MKSVHDLGHPERIRAAGQEWAARIFDDLIALGHAPGSAVFLDEMEVRAGALTKALRIDSPFAGALALVEIRDEIARLTEAAPC